MLFSILIPVYNVENYLDECLTSVLSQGEDNMEIILIDDGSTDASGRICDQYANMYPDKIRVLHKENQGLLMARRDALKLAKGDYILFCDSDDYYMPGAFQELKNIIRRHKPDIILYNLLLSNFGKVIGKLNRSDLAENEHIFADKKIIYDNLLLNKWNVNSLAMKCIKYTCVCADKDYSSYIGLKYGEDLLQSIGIYSAAEKIVYINKDIYCYRQGSGMMGKYDFKFYHDFMKIYHIFDQYCDKWDLDNYEQKHSYYCLHNACVAIHRLNSVDVLPVFLSDYFKQIGEDEEFRKNYKLLRNKGIIKLFHLKKGVTLYLLYHRCYLLLRILIICMQQHKKYRWRNECDKTIME